MMNRKTSQLAYRCPKITDDVSLTLTRLCLSIGHEIVICLDCDSRDKCGVGNVCCDGIYHRCGECPAYMKFMANTEP